MKVSEALHGAREALEAKGWTQYSSLNTRGERCALGAIAYATVRGPFQPGLYGDTKDVLCEAVGIESIVRWNDTRDRTIDEVIDGFRKAEALALSRELVSA